LTKKLQKTLSYGSAIATVLAVSPGLVLAQDIDLRRDIDQFPALTQITPQRFLTFMINGLLLVAGLAAFFYLLIGGVQWVLAGGDKEGTEKARKKITNALIGLAIVFSAYALAFLIETIFKVSILSFNIPTIVP
jgi:hypothetical protein